MYVAPQPSTTAAAALMYAPVNQQVPQQQWQWPPQQQQQHQLIYPSGVPQYPQQSLMVPMPDPIPGAGSNNGGVACAYLGHDAAGSNQLEMLRG